MGVFHAVATKFNLNSGGTKIGLRTSQLGRIKLNGQIDRHTETRKQKGTQQKIASGNGQREYDGHDSG